MNGSVVSRPVSVPTQLWQSESARPVYAEAVAENLIVRMEASGDIGQVARGYDKALAGSGWKSASQVSLNNSVDTWYQREDGTIFRVWVTRRAAGQSSVYTEFHPPPAPLAPAPAPAPAR